MRVPKPVADVTLQYLSEHCIITDLYVVLLNACIVTCVIAIDVSVFCILQTYVYTICRSDPNFTLTPTIALQAFCNDPTKEDVVQTLGSKTRSKGEYKPEKLLFIDEKFKNSNAGRGELSHLVWQPTVRFNSKDYEFALDEEKRPFLVQVDMEMDQSPENNGGGSSVPEHTQIVGVQQPDPLRDPDAEEPAAATEQQQDAVASPHFRRPLP